ncbi:uncharacterized protein THITE_2092597 [Thermothielavioides terrestris NRRL 8126]|uniref:Uncharacterized protein n=1 Tax=Thermothielavioides terrestris (strain ATCC 38088 / NRRL 8126) TaxID=578455 RepID=G2RGQ4_THETT|nr:uncharacterized protein THITE_2092597 [Thermothielavioides terrestris NRRL 8126]AEO71086.1 hypothetical protein THITE_2092597 [Thermothielavioides terrestris NRRL 8126]
MSNLLFDEWSGFLVRLTSQVHVQHGERRLRGTGWTLTGQLRTGPVPDRRVDSAEHQASADKLSPSSTSTCSAWSAQGSFSDVPPPVYATKLLLMPAQARVPGTAQASSVCLPRSEVRRTFLLDWQVHIAICDSGAGEGLARLCDGHGRALSKRCTQDLFLALPLPSPLSPRSKLPRERRRLRAVRGSVRFQVETVNSWE